MGAGAGPCRGQAAPPSRKVETDATGVTTGNLAGPRHVPAKRAVKASQGTLQESGRAQLRSRDDARCQVARAARVSESNRGNFRILAVG